MKFDTERGYKAYYPNCKKEVSHGISNTPLSEDKDSREWANINDIVRAIKEVVGRIGRYLLQQVLKQYEKVVLASLCEGKDTLIHRRKGRRGKPCRGIKGWVRKGWVGRERSITTGLGEVRIKLAQVKCKACGMRLSPLLRWLGLPSYQREEIGIKQQGIDLVLDLSYRRGSKQLENISHIKVSKSRLHRWVKETPIELDIALGSWPKLIYVDGTGYHRQNGTRGEIRLVLLKGFSGKVDGVKVYVDRSWEEIGKELKSLIGAERLRGCVLLSDGEPGIEENLLVEGMEHQRCLWHAWKDLGYMLWTEGMSKEERDSIGGTVKRLSVSFPFEEKTVREKDKGMIREKLKEVRISLGEMTAYLRSRGYLKAAGYLQRAGEKLFTYVELWLEKGIEVSRTIDIVERTMREVARRVKRIGASWGDVGLLAVLKFLLKRYFDNEGYKRYWGQHYNAGTCQATLIT